MNKLDIVSKKMMIKVNDEVSKQLSKEWKNLETQLNKLKAVNTNDIEPMVRISTTNETFLREDKPGKVFDKETVLKNAPTINGDFISLPKVVKND